MRMVLVGALLLSTAQAAEVYQRLQVAAENLLVNGDLERRADGKLAGWGGWEAGYEPAPGGGRDGSLGAVCERRQETEPGRGVAQTVVLNQTRPAPILVEGWSRAEGVSGSSDVDYSLYCDLVYTDGTPLWGQITRFRAGSHDWQRARVEIAPARAVRSITVYGLFRKHLGKAWFDDFAVREFRAAPGVASLDGVPALSGAAPSGGPPASYQAGPLTVDMAGQRVTGLSLAGRDVTSAGRGGFLACDVAADSGWHDFADGRCAALGLRLETQVEAHDDHLLIDGKLLDETGRDRAISLYYALPLAADGWTWGHDISTATKVDADGNYGDWNAIEAGRNGHLSRYPFASVAGPAGAVNLGIDMTRPCFYRLGYSGGAGLLYLAMDFGLSPVTRNFPSAAPFRLVVFPSDSEWGFRAALEAYQRIFPETFRLRTPEQGIWQAFANCSQVQGFEDFGFRFKEGDDEPAWDEAHGLLTFHYDEMGTFWMPMAKDVPRDEEHALALLREYAADPKSKYHVWAQATLNGGIYDEEGRLAIRFERAPWCDGVVFSQNPSPYLEGTCQATIAWGPQRRKVYEPGSTSLLDGEYLDSLEGYVTAPLNYRPDHLAAVTLPLTYTLATRRPVIHLGFSVAEFAGKMSRDVHDYGKLMMANSVPYRFGFLCAWFDIMGTETNWLRGGRYTPDDDTIMNLRRSLSGQRPYLLLLNTTFEQFGPYVEHYFQRALAFGMLPSMFSHNACDDHYFKNPAWYNRDRALFKRYIPLIKQVAEAGWQPVTGARCDNPAIRLERFGPARDGRVHLTIHNPTDRPQSATITLDPKLLPGRPRTLTISLEPYATQVR